MANSMDELGEFAGETVAQTMGVGEPDKPYLYNLVITGDDVRIARPENRSAKVVAHAFDNTVLKASGG